MDGLNYRKEPVESVCWALAFLLSLTSPFALLYSGAWMWAGFRAMRDV